MECAVCYENVSNCKLVCSHQFCKSCVKIWYLKGGTCPMCRKNIHYRRMPITKWKKEADEDKKTTVYQEAFDDLIETMLEPMKFEIVDVDSQWEHLVPGEEYTHTVQDNIVTIHRRNVAVDNLVDLEKTYRAIKNHTNSDEIDFLLKDTDEYYSDRRVHLSNRSYNEYRHIPHPPKKFKAQSRRIWRQ